MKDQGNVNNQSVNQSVVHLYLIINNPLLYNHFAIILIKDFLLYPTDHFLLIPVIKDNYLAYSFFVG